MMLANNVEGVRALISAGADVNAKDNDGKSVLWHQYDENIIQLMKESGAK